jgi:hypothetical protein
VQEGRKILYIAFHFENGFGSIVDQGEKWRKEFSPATFSVGYLIDGFFFFQQTWQPTPWS